MSQLDQLVETLAEQIASRAMEMINERIAEAADTLWKDGFKIFWLEKEAAELLGCSEQTLYLAYKAKLIDSTTNPAGRRGYMVHHLIDYLIRNESRTGKRTIELADVLKFPGNNYGRAAERKTRSA